MSVIGFSFSKFDARKEKPTSKGQIEINHSMSISNIEKVDFSIQGGKIPVLKVYFNFEIKYSKGIGSVSISGDLLYSDTEEIIVESEKIWKDGKKISPIISEKVHSFIYSKAIVKAIELTDSLGLPAPIPLPSVKAVEPTKNKK